MAAAQLQIFKCESCGIVVEVLHAGGGELVCCGEPMSLLQEKTADKTTEKHVPVIEKTDNGVTVTVGTTLHPMEPDHYIEWIEILSGNKAYRQFLKPGDEPKATFTCCPNCSCENVTAREYCNKHGLWKS